MALVKINKNKAFHLRINNAYLLLLRETPSPTSKTKMKKGIKKLIAQHLTPQTKNGFGDWDHNQIKFNQIKVDKDSLENLLDAVWQTGYSKGSHDMADLMNELTSKAAYNAKWGLVDANERYKKLA